MTRKTEPAHGANVDGLGRNDGGRLSVSVLDTTPTGAACQTALHNAQGHVCAHLDGRTLRKTIDGEKHWLQRPRGIAFDVAILAAARKEGCELAAVYDKATRTTWHATLADFTAHGVAVNRGFGPQVCLPVVYWRSERADEPRQLRLL